MRPMLAKTIGPKYSTWPAYCQPKLNGVRALVQLVTNKMERKLGPTPVWQSRDEKMWSPNLLDHLSHEIYKLKDFCEGLILDGELYVHGWRLQRINGAVAVNRKEPSVDTPHVCFHVFDVVDPQRPFSDRWFDIYHLIQQADLPHIKAVPTAVLSDRNDLDLHFHMYTRLGYEGIMIRPDGPYEFGEHEARSGEPRMTQYRSKFLFKHKQWQDDEYFCIGTTPGEGKANIGIGALILGRQNRIGDNAVLGPTFKVGTGFSDEDRIFYMQNPPIGKLVKVRYLCLTDDGIPFNPSFMCVIDP